MFGWEILLLGAFATLSLVKEAARLQGSLGFIVDPSESCKFKMLRLHPTIGAIVVEGTSTFKLYTTIS